MLLSSTQVRLIVVLPTAPCQHGSVGFPAGLWQGSKELQNATAVSHRSSHVKCCTDVRVERLDQSNKEGHKMLLDVKL
jgi:hypothetical protein